MTTINDFDNKIGNLEKINTLWKQYNNIINTKPSSYVANEEIPFNNYILNNDIFNQNIPNNILINSDVILNIILPNTTTVEFLITANDFSSNNYFFNIDILDKLFDQSNNILAGSKCNFENLGYDYIEFCYKKECYPTIKDTTDQIYTWFIPEPSNGNITSINTDNLLKNTISFLQDPYYNTYKYKLFYKLASQFISINFASNPHFAYLDNKSGFLYFYGGIRNGNSVVLNNIRSQNDSNPSPPYMSYIRYKGNVGFNNLIMNGSNNIDGSLNINNDLSFVDISNNDYNVLNTKQIKQYVENLNISGGSGISGESGLTLNQILNSNNDASFSNLVISGNLNILDNNLINYIEYNVTSQGGNYYINGNIKPELFFEINKIYRFNLSDSTNNSHPLRFYSDSNKNNQINDNIIIKGNPGSNGSYVQISITENTSKVFYYQCASHPNMGNKITIMPNFSNKYIFDISSITTTNNSIQDLSSLFFNTIVPSKNNSNILVTINANLYCSYALEERISVELWRDLSMLTQSNNLGSTIATGGLTIPFNLTYLDLPNNNTLTKYYLKYQIENNNSLEEMGLINIQTSQNNGFSNIILREI